MNKKEFIKYVRKNLKKKKIKLVIGSKDTVNCDGLSVGGYFCETRRVLKIAGKGHHVLGILCHEYCHFLQMLDGGMPQYEDRGYEWEDWINGEIELPKQILHNEFLAIRNYELDCEKRAAKLIEELKLPVDVKRYIQGANSYMYFLAFVKKTRTWPDKLRIRRKEILNEMPAVFLKANQYNTVPKVVEELFIKHSAKK